VASCSCHSAGIRKAPTSAKGAGTLAKA
jgi:hypothetical protein